MTQVMVIGVLPVLGVVALNGESAPAKVTAAPTLAMIPMASRRLIGTVEGFVGSTLGSLPVDEPERFVYHKSMDVERHGDVAVSRIAAAIGEPARARILYCLMDGHARTSTELAVVAKVSPSTASVHLDRLKVAHLVNVTVQGKHRFYGLAGPDVANALEGLSVLAGSPRQEFVPHTPSRLRAARTCYDHVAGTVGVLLHDRFRSLRWLTANPKDISNAYDLSLEGTKAFEELGIDVDAVRALRRKFACACLDWSERRPHLGGALGAAVLEVALKRKWMVKDLDSRILSITGVGRREMQARFDVHL
jgi:DNA-binding transcriptional ArsR family regulator